MSHAYRSAYQQIVSVRLAETRLAREMVAPLLPGLRSVRAARLARSAAGAVGIAGACLMVLLACIDEEGGATHALVGSTVAMAVTYVLTRAAAALGATTMRRSPTPPRLTGDLEKDLARIDAQDPLHRFDRQLGKLELWSTALPLAAVSLLAPLTLHYAFISFVGGETPQSFATWIRVSLVIVGHAHLTLMALAIAFGRKMTRADSTELAQMSIHSEWAKAWAITVGVSCVPGILLFLMPPVLTAITGLAFIPLMFLLMRRRVLIERDTMAVARSAGLVRVSPAEARELDATDWAASAIEEAELGRVTGRT